jgi:hypothetical protein
VTVSAKNAIGWSDFSSENIEGIIVQLNPTTVPEQLSVDSLLSNAAQITIIIAEISDIESVGGSVITSYSLEWDQGSTGANYYPVVGYDSDSLALEYSFTSLTIGVNYQFRHRVANIFGWSPYSTYIA